MSLLILTESRRSISLAFFWLGFSADESRSAGERVMMSSNGEREHPGHEPMDCRRRPRAVLLLHRLQNAGELAAGDVLERRSAISARWRLQR